jgi:hypothetical protein
MIISEKQQQANRQNAQKSTGPNTPEGREAIRFNALTYGLRTRETILPNEDCRLYSDLWDELEADWRPQGRTERIYLETMVTSQWLLRRIAQSEQEIYIRLGNEAKFKMLAYVYKQRARLERSFRTAVADMQQSQKERRAVPTPPPQTEQTAKPASAPAANPAAPQAPPPDYVMSEGDAADSVSCAPVAADTR